MLIILFMIFILSKRIFRVTGNEQIPYSLNIIPVILLLVLHNELENPLATEMALLFSLLAFYLYYKLRKYSQNRIMVYLILTLTTYLLAGSGFILFSLLCGIYEIGILVDKKSVITGGLYFVSALIVPYLFARFIFIISLQEAYFSLAPFTVDNSLSIISTILICYYPLVIFVMIFSKNYSTLPLIHFFSATKTGHLIIDSIRITSVYILLFVLFNNSMQYNEKRSILQADYYAQNRQWEKILQLDQDPETQERMISFFTNRALFHSGKLLEKMFSFSQYWGADGLFVDRLIHKSVCIHNSDLHFELGLINDSQRWAYEALTKFGPHPRILKRLTNINKIVGNEQAARNNIAVLQQSLYYNLWEWPLSKSSGNDYLTEKEISLIRSGLPVTKRFLNSGKPDVSLQELLRSNERNKMAFEYLMAYYLLKHEYPKVIHNIKRFRELGHQRLPRYIEEAVLLHQELSYNDTTNLHGYSISKESRQRFMEYFAVLKTNRRGLEKAQKELNKKFRDTYWFYLQFLSPIKNGRTFDYKSDDNWKPL